MKGCSLTHTTNFCILLVNCIAKQHEEEAFCPLYFNRMSVEFCSLHIFFSFVLQNPNLVLSLAQTALSMSSVSSMPLLKVTLIKHLVFLCIMLNIFNIHHLLKLKRLPRNRKKQTWKGDKCVQDSHLSCPQSVDPPAALRRRETNTANLQQREPNDVFEETRGCRRIPAGR